MINKTTGSLNQYYHLICLQVDILLNNAGITPVPDLHYSQDKLGELCSHNSKIILYHND